MEKRRSGASSGFATASGRSAAGATSSLLLVLFAAVLLGAPSQTQAPRHPDEDAPRGPLTQPNACHQKCKKMLMGYYIAKEKDTRASGPTFILGNYNYERYILDPAAADVVDSALTSWPGTPATLECCQRCVMKDGCKYWHLKPPMNGQPGQCTMLGSQAGLTVKNWDKNILPTFFDGECNPLANTNDDPHFRGADGTQYDFNGLLDRSFCLLSDRRIHINMGIKGYQPIANLPGTATSLDEESLAAALEAAANEKKPRHIRQLEQEQLSVEELSELERMRANGSLPLTAEVVAALDREMGRRSGGNGGEEEHHSIQYEKDELKKRLLKAKPIRSWIRELQVMWRDSTGAQHSVFIKARDGKEQGRGSSGFIDRLELDGSPVAPPLSEGSSITGSGGFKLLLAETRSCKGKDEDEFHLTIDGLVAMGIMARLAHPLMQTATEAQAHFNVHIARLNHTSGIHGVLGQTFRAEESRKVRSLRYRLLTRLLREPVEVESESGRGFLDGRTEDYITSDIHSADCMYAAAWRREEHESSDGSDFM